MPAFKDVVITYGDHTYGKIDIIEWGRGSLTVGKYCSITSGVKAFLGNDHNLQNISTYPFGHRNMPITRLCGVKRGSKYVTRRNTDIVVGNDVWLGYDATLFRGITVGDGAVVGAFSTVTKDVPPYGVVVGMNRLVKKRFSEDEIDILMKLKWWDWPDEDVAKVVSILHSSDVRALQEWAVVNGHG